MKIAIIQDYAGSALSQVFTSSMKTINLIKLLILVILQMI